MNANECKKCVHYKVCDRKEIYHSAVERISDLADAYSDFVKLTVICPHYSVVLQRKREFSYNQGNYDDPCDIKTIMTKEK